MGYTSTAVKSRYNAKTYTRFECSLRNEDFAKIDSMRGGLSRAAFLKHLVAVYEEYASLHPDSPLILKQAGTEE